MTNTTKLELVDIRKASGKESLFAAYMVKFEGRAIGFIEKYRNTRTETHPWKAFGAKPSTEHSGCFQYDATFFFTFYGADGKARAIMSLLAEDNRRKAMEAMNS